jgi:predicted GTPase
MNLSKAIKDILSVQGCFSVGELLLAGVDTDTICVGSLGRFVALAEYFTEDYVEINIYDPASYTSDAIDTYMEKYENLSDDILLGILTQCEQWDLANKFTI